ncbi:uncharacterized protein PAC_08241 [Phialocephala subalpina]|uniref:Uncharacterized protein n=1 Tax=Phialocephala subalpina TaxID=576137 RepID=A0A1L7WZZ9_9HELO|nr:uncharacterized protein PAC_08241 [Phialocephala subalpina]
MDSSGNRPLLRVPSMPSEHCPSTAKHQIAALNSKRRGLSIKGTKAQLIERISIECMREIHHRKLHDLKQEALKNVIPEVFQEEADGSLWDGQKWTHIDGGIQERHTFSDAVVADLKVAKSIAVRRYIWDRYRYQGWYGDELRQHMTKALPNLESVMLVSGSDSGDGRVICAARGHIELDDKPYSIDELDLLNDDRGMTGFLLSREVVGHFLKRSETEVVPDIRYVQAKRITKVPGEYCDHTREEPYAVILKAR